MSWKLFIDIIGWIGSFEVVVAYYLVSTHKSKPDSVVFQLLNLTGGIFLIANTYYYTSYPSTFINVIWVIVAVFALIKVFFKKSTVNRPE